MTRKDDPQQHGEWQSRKLEEKTKVGPYPESSPREKELKMPLIYAKEDYVSIIT